MKLQNQNLKVIVLIPCRNEAEQIPATISELIKLYNLLAFRFEIEFLILENGSRDKSYEILLQYTKSHPQFRVVSIQAKNQRQCLWQGLNLFLKSSSSFVLSLDFDLQDDLSLVEIMLVSAEQNYDLVGAYRTDRATDMAWLRWGSRIIYGFISLANNKWVRQHGEFRLMSRSLVERMVVVGRESDWPRLVAPWVAQRPLWLPFERKSRKMGKSKYTLLRYFQLSAELLMTAIRLNVKQK